MNRFFSGLVGSINEAWHELRTHKTRVMLSLVGVAVAVCSLATVVAAGDLLRQTTTETNERYMGRPATLKVNAAETDGGGPVNPKQLSDAFVKAAERYKVPYATRVGWTEQSVQFIDGATKVQTTLVDYPYQQMHRVRLIEGEWFGKDDAQRHAPAVLVNSALHRKLGSPDLRTHPTLELIGRPSVTAVVIGVTQDISGGDPAIIMLIDSFQALPPKASQMENEMAQNLYLEHEMWVPVKMEDGIAEAVQRDIGAEFGSSAKIEVRRTDQMGGDYDPAATFTLVIGGIAGLVLLLGALSLLNISIVTVKQRVREIGIRRSCGATASRIFFSVMMESVVATVAAGAVGVAVAIAIMRSPLIDKVLQGYTLMDTPPFPVGAAVFGMAAATIIGALAGLIPAIYAVRVKVIDAIRF